ncbi:MAG: arginase [Thermodesulfobacteriota bacterium]
MEKKIRIIGVPMDLGQNHRGVDMAPSAIRYAGLSEALQKLAYEVHDMGNLAVPQRFGLEDISEQALYRAIHHGCELACETGRQVIEAGESAIFLGGDHTIALGSINGINKNGQVGVIWFDAHADCNTPATTLTGNIHGMPLAVLLGHGSEELVNVGGSGACLHPEDAVILGVRNLDGAEKQFLRDLGVTVFTMRDIDEQGMAAVMTKTLHDLRHCSQLHVSLDMDGLDPKDAPGVGTPCSGGITYREAQLAMEIIADTGRCLSLDIVEINPILDQGNKTAQIAVELAASLAGKTIL